MKNNQGLAYIGDAVAVVFTAMQTDAVFQYISLGLTILATLCSIAISMLQLWKWWKNAKKDGKITEEEINDGQKIIEDIKQHIEDGKNQINGKKGK